MARFFTLGADVEHTIADRECAVCPEGYPEPCRCGGLTIEDLLHCVCGHAERDHVAGGRCRVPDCPCEHYQPGDTFPRRAQGAGIRTPRRPPS